jgi:DNA-binding NtrC family response regulator
MKTTALNLMIHDDNIVIAGPLSQYLANRFGEKINVSSYSDTDICMSNINKQSHVIILNYFLQHEDKRNKKGLKVFDSIKKRNPETKVTMLTSYEDVTMATEDMKRGTSKYMKLNLLNKVLISPFKTAALPITAVIILPVKQVIHYYKIENYVMMFVVAFASMAILVLAVILSLKLMGFK